MAGITAFSLIIFTETQLIISKVSYVALLAQLVAFVSWFIASRVSSLKHDPTKRIKGQINDQSKDGDYYDDPITNDEEDLLGRVSFVDRLSQQILQLPSPSSFVFGLYGSWGEGKTSVLKLLQARLAKSPNVITVSFNPWYFADETALVQAFYNSIEQELSRSYIISGLHRTIKRYKQSLTSAFGYFGLEIPIADDPERLRAELESYIQRVGSRLVIIIDDVDRLQPDEMIAVLKLVRLSARLQNTIFLLSFDHLVVIETLKARSGLDPEFLDKIIQKPIALPPAEQRDIDRFLLFSDPKGPSAHLSAIDRLLDELDIEPARRKEFDDQYTFFYHKVARKRFTNIRHAKRYMNGLRAALPPIVGEVNLHDFFLLELLHIFYPKIYKDIWSNPWFYLPAWAQEIFLVYPFARASGHDEKYALILEHIKSFLDLEREQEIAQDILIKLFFEVENAFQTHGRTGHDNEAETFLASKRITHPKCFPKYFLFRIPVGEFADVVVEKLIAGWNSATDPEMVVSEDLRYHQGTRQLEPLLQKLRIFRNLISVERVPSVVRGASRIAPDVSGVCAVAFDPWTSERFRLVTFLMTLINDRAEVEEIEPIIRETVGQSDSFPFVVSIVYECVTRDSGFYFRIYEKVDRVSLRNLASRRLSEHFIQGRRDIFAELSERDMALVLYYWATSWRTDSQDNRALVQNYVLDLIDEKPECLGGLLCSFGTRAISTSGEVLGFDYQGFTRAFDAKAFDDRLDRYGEVAITTKEAKEFAKLFREQFDADQLRSAEAKP